MSPMTSVVGLIFCIYLAIGAALAARKRLDRNVDTLGERFAITLVVVIAWPGVLIGEAIDDQR